MAKVFVKFPKTGLGNMMLVWAHAIVFARINELEVVTSSWWGFRWGALLRGEKRKRLYRNYFKETNLVKRNLFRFKLLFIEVVKDPDISKLSIDEKTSNKIFLFQKIIRDDDLFKFLRDHQPFIKEELYKILNDQKKQELSKYPNPNIALHVRRGDFKMGNKITPLSHFIRAINIIRKVSGEILPVTIFTDATKNEISELLALQEVSLAAKNPDIIDLLLMSRSRFIVSSADSTFSYWAAFLSGAFVIIPFNDWQKKIKDPANHYVEIKWDASESKSSLQLEETLQKIDFNAFKIYNQ